MTRFDTCHASVSYLDSQIAALSTNLYASIGDISGNLEVVMNAIVKEELKYLPDDINKLRAYVHNGMDVDYQKIESFIKHTMDKNDHDYENVTPGDPSQKTRNFSGNWARHKTPTAGAGNTHFTAGPEPTGANPPCTAPSPVR